MASHKKTTTSDYGQGLPPSKGWKRDMTGAEALYTQADQDFLADIADDYFAMYCASERRSGAALKALYDTSQVCTERVVRAIAALEPSPVPEEQP